MYRTCIAVADASRARLFNLERTNDAEGLRERMLEVRDLVNPARRLRPSQLFSDSRPGSGRTGRLQFAFDDHRDAHVATIDAEFARDVAGAIAAQLRDSPAHHLIVCASPHMLGALRNFLDRTPESFDEIASNYVKLSPTELRAQLDASGVLP